MSVGKYSPTVSRWYADDQNWWYKNGGYSDLSTLNDDEGYDSYGYSDFDENHEYVGAGNGVDRAGYTESEYMQGAWDENEYTHDLYERISDEWWKGKQKYKNQN